MAYSPHAGQPYSWSSPATYEPRAPPLPSRAAAPSHYYTSYPHGQRKHTWPPSPSVEDERASLAREAAPPSSAAVRPAQPDGEPPPDTRGTIDQESLLDDIEPPAVALSRDDRRFVLVPDETSRLDPAAARDGRRKSVAERGNLPHLQTQHAHEPPVFTERVSTPYAYTRPTRPQRESTAPSPQSTPKHSRRNSLSRSADVVDDSDLEPEDTIHLRTERKPARYSFVNSSQQKEDLRAGLHNTPSDRPSLSGTKPPPLRRDDSTRSSRNTPYAQSPMSSSSSLNSNTRKTNPPPTETPPRPRSPVRESSSPKLPPRFRESPPSSRPSSKGNGARPASPLAFSTATQAPSSSRVPVTQSDWHSTYPPVPSTDRSMPPSRFGRHETMPLPTPRIDVQSPSPARPPPAGNFLPYPVDDRPVDVFMPPEEHYQFDHSSVTSPRQPFLDSPRVSSSPHPSSPHVADVGRPSQQTSVTTEEPTRMRRTRGNSIRSQSSHDNPQEQPATKSKTLHVDRPLPSCPRSSPSSRYDDWFSLQGFRNFDVCPSCYEGVFAETPFAPQFSQTRQHERPVERFCDFSSPWMRLAWLLTIKQRRPSLDLLYALAAVADDNNPCPGDRELGTDRVVWYGIPDQRDGIHIANFAVCSCDKKMIEILFPSIRGYFTKLPTSYESNAPSRFRCSLRTTSRRFPMYLDLLVELDAEAQSMGQRPKISRFIQLVRDNAFKGECAQDKASKRKPWHFIPSFPELTVCEECYEELIWPASQSKGNDSAIPRLFNATIQLVPDEDVEVGSSCCLYSPRMRRIWSTSVEDNDFAYLKRKALERKRAEARLSRERNAIMTWMAGADRGGSQWERARNELKDLEREWAAWE